MRHLVAMMVVAGTLAAGGAAGGEKVFRAGAYAQDITPQKFPVSVNGGMSDRQATAAPRPRCTPAAWSSTTARPSSPSSSAIAA